MGLTFEWDASKSVLNAEKHGVSFEEAATAFADPLSITIHDPDHSVDEHRYVLLGSSARGRLVVVVHAERDDNIRIISARRPTRREAAAYEVGDVVKEDRAEYDFRGGQRGKHADRFADGSNIVVLDPDIAERFKDSRAVNEALRQLVNANGVEK